MANPKVNEVVVQVQGGEALLAALGFERTSLPSADGISEDYFFFDVNKTSFELPAYASFAFAQNGDQGLGAEMLVSSSVMQSR